VLNNHWDSVCFVVAISVIDALLCLSVCLFVCLLVRNEGKRNLHIPISRLLEEPNVF
jgi:hypothetical protein